MYEGRTAVGRVTHTISRGRLVWADGRLVCAPGTGRYVPMTPFAPSLFGAMAARDAALARARIHMARAGDGAPAAAAAAAHEEL